MAEASIDTLAQVFAQMLKSGITPGYPDQIEEFNRLSQESGDALRKFQQLARKLNTLKAQMVRAAFDGPLGDDLKKELVTKNRWILKGLY